MHKLKNLITSLINHLLNSKESESKAGGLNILGSLCGLGIELSASKASESESIKISEYLSIFRNDYSQSMNQANYIQAPNSLEKGVLFCGSRLISVSLWQKVFQLSEEDWDSTIRDAATVLIQVCAPRGPIKQFLTISREKY